MDNMIIILDSESIDLPFLCLMKRSSQKLIFKSGKKPQHWKKLYGKLQPFRLSLQSWNEGVSGGASLSKYVSRRSLFLLAMKAAEDRWRPSYKTLADLRSFHKKWVLILVSVCWNIHCIRKVINTLNFTLFEANM